MCGFVKKWNRKKKLDVDVGIVPESPDPSQQAPEPEPQLPRGVCIMKYRRTILSASILASLCLAQAVYAQSAVPPATGADAAADASANATNRKANDPQELSEIVVTGIRESLK